MTASPLHCSPLDKKSLVDRSHTLLGWNLVQSALARHAYSPATQVLCRELVPEADLDSANLRIQETDEMTALLNLGEPFPLGHFEDPRPILKECREHHSLEPRDGLVILNLIRISASVRKRLDMKEGFPLLCALADRLHALPDLHRELDRCLDEDGEIRDNASPELKQAIRDAQEARSKLESHIGKLLSHATIKEAVQDSYYTEREGRLVLPIKTEFRGRVDGIVHDSSGSGQTVFMEPSQIIPLNNQLKLCRLRIQHEKARILQMLAGKILEHASPLSGNLECLTRLDLIHARSRLGKTLGAQKCRLSPNGRVKLIHARNPELVLNGQSVVANDLDLEQGTGVVIISGPNTGGKTVTLKTLGLMTLMVRAGLFLPVAEGSEIPFFPEVYADIGDEQSIGQSLSTFSAHLKKIIHILDAAVPNSLVLLDELGIATDPQEGAALAEAILLQMKRKGVVTLVSTHYLALKVLAQTQEGFLNACMEFDPETLAPTYRLIFGVPGHSAALDTAERLGLPRDIIRRAREIYDLKDHRAESLLQTVTEQRLHLEREREKVRQERNEVQALLDEQKKLTEPLRNETRDLEQNKARKLQSVVREAKLEIRKMVDDVKGTRDLPRLRRTEKEIQSLSKVPPAARIQDFSEWTVPAHQLKQGDAVLLLNYGATGTLLETPGTQKKVRVKLGNLTTVAESIQLRGHPKHKSPVLSPPQRFEIQVNAETSNPRAATSCDLRGMNSDEALSAMEAFLSQALVHKLGRVKIIHGHGMGTIKNLVRDYLGTTGLCKSFAPGSREEGGDGVTVVET
ncbi:MAG: endonuclease MutS2 [Nitrospinae bacterium CG11_big_fil_rev_8_21_14_0_20_56_8]|nr:MAG: endonuclease MutS2 [Nitrospinae bacterium CG11_big_fil_rev_8_21_14_0_20_56_8]